MATHSSLLAWRIPRTEELGGLQSIGLQSIGLQRIGHYKGGLPHMHVDCEVRHIWVSYCVSVMLFSLILLRFSSAKMGTVI